MPVHRCPACQRLHTVSEARASVAYGRQLTCSPECESERRRNARAAVRQSLGLPTAALTAPGPALAPSAAAEPKSPHTFTGNSTLASEYLYRGIAQTRGKPAVQGGFERSEP